MADANIQSPHAHLNPNVRGLAQSATLAINDRCAALERAGRRVYRLGLGQSPFPVPAHVAAALRANAEQKNYLPVKGLPALRRAVADYYRRTEGLAYSPDNVLIGPGTKELMFLVQLVYDGDLVIPTPSWVSYAPQAHIIGRRLRWLPTRTETGLGVTPESLEALCKRDPARPRLLILNYPGNPTGMCYGPAQLEAIAAVARRYRVLLIADEIYSGLNFDGTHVSIARFYPQGTVISNGLSKWCGAGGWRLGAFTFPETLTWLLDGLVAVASETYTSTSAPIQYAAIKAFQGGAEMAAYLKRARLVLAALAAYAWRRLTDAGADVAKPRGGFYLFPNFDGLRSRLDRRGVDTGKAFCERLLEDTGVAVLPGSVFGRPDGELSVRIALVDFDGREALDAAAKTTGDSKLEEGFIRANCAPVVDAIDRLCDWLR
jgi:aspartate aminotransferase